MTRNTSGSKSSAKLQGKTKKSTAVKKSSASVKKSTTSVKKPCASIKKPTETSKKPAKKPTKTSSKTSSKISTETSKKPIKKPTTTTKLRPSPSEHASELKVGTQLMGNDGSMWIVEETPNKIHRWVKLEKPLQKRNSFTLNSSIIIADPAYYYLVGKKSVLKLINQFDKILPGKWNYYYSAYKNQYYFDVYLVHSLIKPSDIKTKLVFKRVGSIPVDSGQIAITDVDYFGTESSLEKFIPSKVSKRNLTRVENGTLSPGKVWYDIVCEVNHGEKGGILTNGFVFGTGGDGLFDLFQAKSGGKVVAFKILL